jgi:hypothetical protein
MHHSLPILVSSHQDRNNEISKCAAAAIIDHPGKMLHYSLIFYQGIAAEVRIERATRKMLP